MARKFSPHVSWSEDEINILLHKYPSECSFDDMALALPGRTKSKIQGKANGLGLKRPVIPKMSDTERLKRKRESMARRRSEDLQGARDYSNNYHKNNREKQCLKMRDYSKRRFFWSRAVRLRKNGRANFKDLAIIWKKQRGICALTGRRLDRSAQLDHILPKARGGSDNKENLQWVCEEVNIAKRHMTDTEFITLCGDVMSWIGERINKVEELI